MEFRFALPSETVQVRNLWKECFGDTDAFLDPYFQNMYSPERTLVCAKQGQVVGSLQIVPQTLLLEGTAVKSAYIGGVDVLPAFRGRGIATSMMKTTLHLLEEQGVQFPFLAPAPGRFSLYRKMGYTPLCCLSDYTGPTKALSSLVAEDNLPALTDFPSLEAYDAFISKRPLALRRTADSVARALTLMEDVKIAALPDDGGYLIYKETENEFFAYECVYRDDASLRRLLGFVARSPKKQFRIRTASDASMRRLLFDNAVCEMRYPHIMVQPKDGLPAFSADSYINMLGWF